MNTKPSWLPDWSDKSCYEDHGDCLSSWAWEFLRRNPEYQADYARWSALPDTDQDENGVSGLTLKYYRTYGDWEPMIYFQPIEGVPPIDGETVGEYEERAAGDVELLQVHLMKKWGLLHELPDPAENFTTEGAEELPPHYVHYVQQEPMDAGKPRPRYLSIHWDQDDDGFMHSFAFDTRYNIESQLKAAGQILKQMILDQQQGIFFDDCKVKRPQIHTSGFIEDLRIWDAVKLHGASRKEIARALWKSEIEKVEKLASKDKNDPIGYLERRLDQRITDSLARTEKNITTGFAEMLKWDQLPAQKRKKERKKS